MARLPFRVYADTSVFGGVFDEEFAGPSRAFFEMVQRGRLVLVVSDLVRDELKEAPIPVRKLWEEMLAHAEAVDVSKEAILLHRAYLKAGIVTERWSADALQVAVASVSACDMIISWNFRHIVNYKRIPLYNAVNALNGFRNIAIHSPLEVATQDEDEDEEKDICLSRNDARRRTPRHGNGQRHDDGARGRVLAKANRRTATTAGKGARGNQ